MLIYCDIAFLQQFYTLINQLILENLHFRQEMSTWFVFSAQDATDGKPDWTIVNEWSER